MSASPHLSAAAFSTIRELIFAVAGISMTEEKEELVKSRLAKRLRELKIGGYEEYLDRIQTDVDHQQDQLLSRAAAL
jgi:chemotaxis protein methyltransferase CheR